MSFRISVGGERFEYHADIKNNFPGHSHENLRKVVYITTVSRGEETGKLLNAYQPISEPGIKPSSLLI